MTHGGARKGAGKPKGKLASHTLEAQELKKSLIKAYAENATEINGVLIQKCLSGDMSAIKELLDRALGKSSQSIVTEDENGNKKPIEGVKIIVQRDES